jgi:GTPase SAR1 family protein
LSYTDADVFLLCFNVMKPGTLRSATQRWLPELRHIAPMTPIVLVGTQIDLRYTMQFCGSGGGYGGYPGRDGCTKKMMQTLSEQCKLEEYIECSAVTRQNLKEVFDVAILHGLRQGQRCRWPRVHPSEDEGKRHNNKTRKASSGHQQLINQKLDGGDAEKIDKLKKTSTTKHTTNQQQPPATFRESLRKIVLITRKFI